MEDLQSVIEQNDIDLKNREDSLIQKVNHAYDEAVKEATSQFQYLLKLNPDVKPSNGQVKRILDRTIAEFRSKFEELVEPFQKELVAQYEAGLREASQVLAVREEKKE
jgi:hypothetical protein